MKVLVVSDEGLPAPLVFATLEAFLKSSDAMDGLFTREDMGNEYLLMLAELEKADGCWSDKTGSVAWIEVQT